MNEEDEESESIDQFQKKQVNSQEDSRNKRKKGKA
jgi:hypothetical protein